jgi:GNAT superfamily N-acetyltransferase
MEIRPLTEHDAAIYRELRLRALHDSPEAFATSVAVFEGRSLEYVAARLRNEDRHPDDFVLGAFLDGRLAGMIGLAREQEEKLQHKALVWGVYTAPEARGRGVGKALMDETVRRDRALAGLEQVQLWVGTYNTPARRLYLNAGFEMCCTERQALKIGDRYIDEEMMVLWLGASQDEGRKTMDGSRGVTSDE